MTKPTVRVQAYGNTWLNTECDNEDCAIAVFRALRSDLEDNNGALIQVCRYNANDECVEYHMFD